MIYDTKADLDLGLMAPERRLAAVLEAFDRMGPGDSMLVDGPEPPLAILHGLQRERRGLFDWAPVDHPPCWRIELSRLRTPKDVPLLHESLAWDHARLDEMQRAVLAALDAGHLAGARHEFAVFEHRLNRHIHFEEELLFPVFEEKAAGRRELTAAMRAEHREIRMMIERAARSLYGALPEARETCRALLAVLEQHDFREEAAFYDLFDHVLTPLESAALVERIQEFA